MKKLFILAVFVIIGLAFFAAKKAVGPGIPSSSLVSGQSTSTAIAVAAAGTQLLPANPGRNVAWVCAIGAGEFSVQLAYATSANPGGIRLASSTGNLPACVRVVDSQNRWVGPIWALGSVSTATIMEF